MAREGKTLCETLFHAGALATTTRLTTNELFHRVMNKVTYNPRTCSTLIPGVLLTLFLCIGCGNIKESYQRGFDKSFKESCRDRATKNGRHSP